MQCGKFDAARTAATIFVSLLQSIRPSCMLYAAISSLHALLEMRSYKHHLLFTVCIADLESATCDFMQVSQHSLRVGVRMPLLPALEDKYSLKALFLVYTPVSTKLVTVPTSSCSQQTWPCDHLYLADCTDSYSHNTQTTGKALNNTAA